MKFKGVFVFTVLIGFLLGCKDKTVDPANNSETNQWISEQMNYWYYWNQRIPANPDTSLTPDKFFSSLLYKYDAVARPDGDRFSVIRESADELKASLSGESKTSGMELKLAYYPKGDVSDLMAIVLYALPGSPAANAGFKRGDIITSINNQKITVSNYNNLLYVEGKATYSLATLNSSGAVVESTVKREVTPVVFQQDPVYFDTLFTYGANRIGYVVYHQFIPGPNNGSNTKFDDELDAVFANFKVKGVNSVVLDLRYNPGGYVSSATNLASLMGKVTSNDIFYIKEYNTQVTPLLEKQYGKDFFSDKFKAKSQNVGAGLNNLIVLTSSRSASASELLINGLKPYMKVTIVGGKTVGKNVGSITISDDTKKVKWGLQPIVTKSFNSLKQSDYSSGFTPDVEVSEGIKLYPYGSPQDPLLGEALFQIVGTHVTRQPAGQQLRNAEVIEVMSTIERKAGGSNMFFDH